MILEFKNQGTEDVFNGRQTKAARKLCPASLFPRAQFKLEYLDSAAVLEDLRVPPGNRLESLSGDRKGQYSIRVNQQFRISFVWTPSGPTEVEIVDYH